MKTASAKHKNYVSFNSIFSFDILTMFACDIMNYRNLLIKYIKRDFVASYKQSTLGIIWKIIMPVIPMSVYLILQYVGVFGSTNAMPKAVYVSIGMTYWQLFTSVLTTTANKLDQEANLIKKVKLPLAVVYLTSFGQLLFDFLVRMLVVLIVLVVFEVTPNFLWLLFPIILVPFLFLGFGLGILASFFIVYNKDFKNMLNILISYGIFVSGVIFPIPNFGKSFSQLLNYNPIFYMIDTLRNILVFGVINEPISYLIFFFVSIVFLLFVLKKLYFLEKRLVSAL